MALLVQAPAKANADPGCAADIGRRNPVLFVHGFTSSESMWIAGGDKSMLKRVAGLSNIYVRTFDYSRANKDWVTSDRIGPALAKRIACMARSSRQAGGPGKVIIIAHSMGGLATRFAADWEDPSTHQKPAAGKIGLVVTIGTPSLGSFLMATTWWDKIEQQSSARVIQAVCEVGALVNRRDPGGLCDLMPNLTTWAARSMAPGSNELKQLAAPPSGIPLRAIAGVVEHIGYKPFGIPLQVPNDSDLVVKKDSAEYGASHRDRGGGSVAVTCHTWRPLKEPPPGCMHTEQAKYDEVQDQVVASIKRYLGTLGPALTYRGMHLPLRQGWRELTEVEWFGAAHDEIGIASGSHCQDEQYGIVRCPGFLVLGPQQISRAYSDDGYNKETYTPDHAYHPGTGVNACYNLEASQHSYEGGPAKLITASTAKIGTKTAIYREWKTPCFDEGKLASYSYYQREWYLPRTKILIVDYWRTPGLKEALEGAWWE